jgi:hypothetical protein
MNVKDKYQDLTGDKAYDYLKLQVLEGHTLPGGYIHEKKIVSPKEPRVVIHLKVQNNKTKKINFYQFNYKKHLKLAEGM